ncbi:MAG: restriction endonuclease subunit S [Fibrobacteria bacterium]|nr:restriction endonuclease subunit S [Fibrobacteria bacterium]
MNLETFFEKFDLFADCPNAVQKMRELILELAVRGKLVEQDGDEWHFDESKPFAIPRRWVWSSLGEVTEIVRGITFPGSAKAKSPADGLVACLRTASIQDEIDWDDLIYVPNTFVGREDQWVKVDDVMISMANSYELVGKVAVVRNTPVRASFGGFIAAIRPIGVDPFFLLYYLRSPGMQSAFRESSSQTTNIANISLGRMRPLPFPLPPLAEQKRVVAKVDELMALCDALEAQQKERETKRTALAKASLAAFAEAPSPQSLELLFHSSYAIDPADLRKSILTLAVQGKLVEQREEEVDSLIELISNQRNALGAKNYSSVSPDDYFFDIPESWSWVRMGNIWVYRLSNG